MPVGGNEESTLSIESPGDGILNIRIEERGVSVVATLDGDPRSAAESPVERLGRIQLVASSRRGQSHTLTVKAEDSPDIVGEYCARADLIADSDKGHIAAAEAFASAGQATHRNDWADAFDHYLIAARQFAHLKSRRSTAMARHALAEIAYLRLDRKRDSYALAAEALADYGDKADSLRVAELASLQAKALLDMPGVDIHNVAPRVRELQQAAIQYFRTDPLGARELPRVVIMAGFLEYRMDAPTRARAAFSDAAATCKRLRDWDCYAIASQNLAMSAYESRNYTIALSAFSDVLRLLPPELDPKLSADIWNNYGSLQGLMGLYSSSERSHATAMRQYAALGDCQGVRRNLARSGNLLVQLGTLSDAMNDLQHAASLDCGRLLTVATDPHARPTAPAWCSKALELNGLATDNRLIVFNSLVWLGDALMLEGETRAAQRCLEAAGPYATTARTRMHLANARGTALLEVRDAAAARAAFQQAIQIADAARIPAAHEYRGQAQLGIVKAALLAGNFQGAIRDGLPALEASINRGDIDQTVASLRLLAAGYRGAGDRAGAARTLQTAVDLIEAVPIDELDGEKRATFLATQYTVFAELTDLYASASEANSSMASMAFSTSERGRARSLRYAVTQAERNAVAAPEMLPAARYQQLLQDVVKIPAARAGSLIDELDTAALRERKAEPALDQSQLAQTLGQLHGTLIEYAVGTSDMFAFVVNESGLHVTRLGDRLKIANAAAELHDRLLDPETPQNEVREAARHLAELVLWPLTAQLTGKRLIFVPDDGLHTVPFNVLPWSATPADLLVLQHAEASIVPSALFLTQDHSSASQHVNAPRIALLGDPVFRISDWHRECPDVLPPQTSAKASRAASDWTEWVPRLPGSRAEVQMVARLGQQSHPSSRIEMLLGCAAVPTALRRAAGEHVDLLHIATHARVDSQRPRLSALALTPEATGDGAASAFGLLDILGLKLSSPLVVLSACETSRGRLLPGEGVLGPAQAFLQAGAAAVVASYWRVDDEATFRFMQQFYQYLLTERLPAATALRRAQLQAAESGSLHEWAAFSLYGWPDSAI